MIKPKALKAGDVVAAVSPSWGGPSLYPGVFERGVRNLEALLGVTVREFPTARMPNDELYRNPQIRAEDINAAFADPEVSAIFASIGGDDSVRILPYLDLATIKANPKILMGFSDTTTLTTTLNQHGLVTFNGPSIMAGWAQLDHLDRKASDDMKAFLSGAPNPYRPYETWIQSYTDWNATPYAGLVEPEHPNEEGWQWLQGSARVEGKLFGGCIEVLEFMKGTAFWPGEEFWDDKILFFETSEDKPPVSLVKYFLRNYGSIGALSRIRGLLFGRARSYSAEEKQELYEMIGKVATIEFGREDLPIVANLDFGHTDPQWILPLGVNAEIDCESKQFRLTESPFEL